MLDSGLLSILSVNFFIHDPSVEQGGPVRTHKFSLMQIAPAFTCGRVIRSFRAAHAGDVADCWISGAWNLGSFRDISVLWYVTV